MALRREACSTIPRTRKKSYARSSPPPEAGWRGSCACTRRSITLIFYWKLGRGVLTQHPIGGLPRGPGIDQGRELLLGLQQEGKIKITTRPNGPYQEYVYELTKPVEIDPTRPRYKAIEEAVEWVRDKSAV